MEIFFVETADYVCIESLDELMVKLSVKKESMLVIDLLKLVTAENQIDLSSVESKIILDDAGRLVSHDKRVIQLLEEHGPEDQMEEERTRIVFVLGSNCNSEDDLNFVNQTWKKYENDSGSKFLLERSREVLLLNIREMHSNLKARYSGFAFLMDLKGLEQAYAQLNSRIKHIKKRLQVFEFFERLRVSVYRNHNELVDASIEDVLKSVERARDLISEFRSSFSRLNVVLEELEATSFDSEPKSKTLMSYFNKDSLLEFATSSDTNSERLLTKVKKIESDLTTLRSHSLMKDDSVKLYRDDTQGLLKLLEEKPEYGKFFEYSQEWNDFLTKLQEKGQDGDEGEKLFKDRLALVTDTMREIDLAIEDIRNNLKKTFFNSIMTSRELIRTSGFIQLKVQNKSQSKKTLVEKLAAGVKDDVKILRVVREFRSTYLRSKKEIERRAKFDCLIVGFMRIMMQLVKEENQQRRKYLRDFSSLLPQSYCPFLANYISEQILRQLEEYFNNDTSTDELDLVQKQSIQMLRNLVEREDVAFSLKSLLEQYMSSSDSLSSIHSDLSAMLASEQTSSNLLPNSGVPVYLRVRLSDMQGVSVQQTDMDNPFTTIRIDIESTFVEDGITTCNLKSLIRK